MNKLSSAPKVSIVTPSYNQGQFIEATINSVLSQDYPNLEYIITDGGSKDESVAIIKKYQDHLAWWVSEKDAGHADAINKGLSHATGEILAWINSDDIYFPGAVSEAVAFLTDHPEVGMVYGDADLIEPHQRAPADAVHDDGIDVVLGQQEDRRHAPALGVRGVVKDLHFAHLAVGHVDHGEALTAAEVAGATGVEPAGHFGGDSDARLRDDLVGHDCLALVCGFIGMSTYAWPPRRPPRR